MLWCLWLVEFNEGCWDAIFIRIAPVMLFSMFHQATNSIDIHQCYCRQILMRNQIWIYKSKYIVASFSQYVLTVVFYLCPCSNIREFIVASGVIDDVLYFIQILYAKYLWSSRNLSLDCYSQSLTESLSTLWFRPFDRSHQYVDLVLSALAFTHTNKFQPATKIKLQIPTNVQPSNRPTPTNHLGKAVSPMALPQTVAAFHALVGAAAVPWAERTSHCRR